MNPSMHVRVDRRTRSLLSVMHYPRVAALAVCLVAALVWLGMSLFSSLYLDRPVYSIVALESHLAHDPAAWLHRSLRVRALLGSACTAMTGLYAASCSASRLALTDPPSPANASVAGDVQPLPLAWGSAPPLLAFLRRLPLVRDVVPRPQILHSSALAVYRVQLQPTACLLSADPPCYEALLLDAIPPDNTTDWVQIGS